MITESQNFALRSVAAIAQRKPEYRDYAECCLSREKGLRKQAFSALTRFLTTTESWTAESKREFVAWLCKTADSLEQPRRALSSAPHTEFYGLFPEPLKRQLFQPVFAEWVAQEPNNVRAHLWRAKYLVQVDGYQRTIEIDPANQTARCALADACSYHLWFATHHLPHYFIGGESEAQSTIREAYAHLAYLDGSSLKESILRDVRYYEQMIHDWIAFQADGESDFSEWCRSRGRDYHWVRTYYYKK